MNTEDYLPDFDEHDLPDGFSLLAKCVRSTTGSMLILKVPRHVTPTTFGDWCFEEIPLGFHPADVLIASDEQIEAAGY